MPKITDTDLELLKEILEKERETIPPKRSLEILQIKFRNTLKTFYDLSKMVGVFSPFESMVPTIDRGSIKGENLIKKLSRDLAEESLTVLTCYHIRTKRDGASNIHTTRLFRELKESDSRIMDFSECLSAVVPNAIFIWNDSKGSTVLHESRAFHENIFNDNIISFNIIFSSDDSNCQSMKNVYENIKICENTDWGVCKTNECHFTKEINAGNREPLVKKKNAILVVSKTYKDIVPCFKEHHKRFWLGQKKLTKRT